MSTELTGNLAKEILGRAARYGERIAVRTENDSVSYAVLRELVINFALHMRVGGIGRSSCVAIDTDHLIIATILPLACSLLGCAWVHDTPMVARNPALCVTHRVQMRPNPRSKAGTICALRGIGSILLRSSPRQTCPRSRVMRIRNRPG